MNHPDPKLHFQISMIKSALRIGAGGALIFATPLWVAGVLLVLAEILGIVEELV